jgi:hypothetical protein
MVNGEILTYFLGIKCEKYHKEDCLESIIRPGALDLSSQMLEDLEEMASQLNKQHSRIIELRKSKLENPGGISCSTLRQG